MATLMRKRSFLVFGALVVALGLFVGISNAMADESQLDALLKEEPVDYQAVQGYLEERIAVVGPDAIYAEAGEAAVTFDGKVGGHALGHALGSALFGAGGSSSIAYCGDGSWDTRGCMHQVMGLSIEAGGTATLSSLKAECERSVEHAVTCAHGIGHALIALLGYEEEHVFEGLSRCRDIYDEDDLLGATLCGKGVVMEYNLREIATADAGKEKDSMLRAYEPSRAYEPCGDVDPLFQPVCLYEMSRLWFKTLSPSMETTQALAATGELCRALPEELGSLRASCFLGVGRSASVESQYQLEEAARLCSAAGGSRKEQELCFVEVAHAAKGRGKLEPSARPCEEHAFGAADGACKLLINHGYGERLTRSREIAL